jgi:hypothetical protein
MTQSAAGNNTFSGQRAQLWVGTILVEGQATEPSEKINDEAVRRLGSQEVAAYTIGEYEPEMMNVTVEAAVWNADVWPSLPDNGFANYKFNGFIYIDHPQLSALKVEMVDCQFRGTKLSLKAEPGASMMDVPIRVRQYKWNGKTLNTISGFASSGASAPIGSVSAAAGISSSFVF